MRFFLIPFQAIIVLLLPACQALQEPMQTATAVEGTILNKYTGQPMPGLTVEAKCWRYGFAGDYSTLIATAQTDAAGHYQLKFDAPGSGNSYRVRLGANTMVCDMTDYRGADYRTNTNGPALSVGQANRADFTATPLRPVRFLLDADKRGASSLYLSFRTDHVSDQPDFNRDVVLDTLRQVQRVMLDTTMYVLPNRRYTFYTTRYTTVRTGPGHYRTDTHSSESVSISLGYDEISPIHL